jgi:hypothetical protein
MVGKKSGADLKSQVEPKPMMRGRTGKSPDIGDAGLGILDFLRSKFRFRAAARANIKSSTGKNWKKFRTNNDFFGKNAKHLDRTV